MLGGTYHCSESGVNEPGLTAMSEFEIEGRERDLTNS